MRAAFTWACLALALVALGAGCVRAWDHDGRHGYARPDVSARVRVLAGTK